MRSIGLALLLLGWALTAKAESFLADAQKAVDEMGDQAKRQRDAALAKTLSCYSKRLRPLSGAPAQAQPGLSFIDLGTATPGFVIDLAALAGHGAPGAGGRFYVAITLEGVDLGVGTPYPLPVDVLVDPILDRGEEPIPRVKGFELFIGEVSSASVASQTDRDIRVWSPKAYASWARLDVPAVKDLRFQVDVRSKANGGADPIHFECALE